MNIFTTKLSLLRHFPVAELIKSEDIESKEADLFAKLSRTETDIDTIRQARIDNRSNILKLQRAVKRVTTNDVLSQEKETLTGLRRYDRLARKQVQDIVQIINLLKQVIDQEYLDILYDLQRPLISFKHFFKMLKHFFHGVHIPRATATEVKRALEQIERAYDELIQHTLEFIKQDFAYFQQLGLNFSGLEKERETDYALETHMKNRSRAKQQINGKTQYIVTQINRIGEIFKELADKEKVDKVLADGVVQNIENFQRQFAGLTTMCMQRVDVANHMLAEAVLRQQEQYQKLREIQTDAYHFYVTLQQEHAQLQQAATPRWKTARIVKQLKAIEELQQHFEKELGSMERGIEEQVDAARREDVEQLKLEREEAEKVTSNLGKFSRSLKLLTASAILIVTAASTIAAVPSSTRPGVVRDAAVQFLKNPGTIKQIVHNLKSANVEEIQQEIFRLNDKLKQGERLGQDETTFLRNIYQAVATAGVVKDMPEAGILLNSYINGDGSAININSDVYQNSTVVQRAMKLMTTHLQEKLDRGEISEGDEGVIHSREAIKKERFDRERVETEGQFLGGGGLLAEQGNRRLKNANNRFTLKAKYIVKDGKLHFTWSIDDHYDFENNPDHVTVLPIPDSDKKLELPDTLSHLMVKEGVAHEFDYHSTWQTEVPTSTKVVV